MASLRGRLAILTLGLAAAGACSSNVESQTRLLDDACGGGECETSGAAQQVTGLTGDSIGYQLGPGPAKLDIPLPTFSDPTQDSFDAEVLAEGHGTLHARLLRIAAPQAMQSVLPATPQVQVPPLLPARTSS